METADVHDAANRWLASVLFGGEPSEGILIAQEPLPASTSLRNAQTHMSDYIFNRGKDKDKGEGGGGGKGEVHGSVGGGRDSNGNESASVDVGGSYHSDSGWDVGGSAGVSGGRDRDGNTRTEVHGEAHGGYNF